MSLDSIRALTLDLFGTLLDVEASVLPGFTDFLATRRYPGSPRSVVQSWENAYFQETMIDTLLGYGRTPFAQVRRAALSQVLFRLKIKHSADEVESLVAPIQHGLVFPDVTEGLLALQSRYTLVVLSNGDLSSTERLVDHLSIPVDQVISAEQAGVYKPHPAVYRTAAEQLGLDKTQILHVASHSWDIRGAKAFGMLGAYVNRANSPYGNSRFPPDLEVVDLFDLAARIP